MEERGWGTRVVAVLGREVETSVEVDREAKLCLGVDINEELMLKTVAKVNEDFLRSAELQGLSE